MSVPAIQMTQGALGPRRAGPVLVHDGEQGGMVLMPPAPHVATRDPSSMIGYVMS